MEDMPRPRKPHLVHEQTRHGTWVWYVRVGKGPRIRIKEKFGTPEFDAAYEDAIKGVKSSKRLGAGKAGTLKWLIERYRDSSAWAKLSEATRRQRDNIFVHIIKKSGGDQYTDLRRQDIILSRDAKSKTPFAARNFLETMRGLFKWALEAEFVKVDPTDEVTAPRPPTKGFHPWSETEIAKYEARWPLGTRERLAMDLLLYTGLRRGDAVRLGRQHVRDGNFTIKTEKTGIEITAPILPELQRSIDATKTGDLAFIATGRGMPMVKEGFGNWFRDACKLAGVPGSAHGLRKAGATRLANNGATVAELEAIYGWTGGGMASLYTRSADRTRLARQAMQKLSSPESGTSIPEKKVDRKK